MNQNYFDIGMWNIIDEDLILHSDFTHDVALKLSGDFGNDEDKRLAVQMICNILNDHIQKRYKYRGLPSSIVEDPWYVGGVDSMGGSGILEWCLDEKDALSMKEKMLKFPQFKGLEVKRFREG